jgi:adenylylsulfate kinase
MKRILIMGLPGSGKTTLAQELQQQLQSTGKTVKWLNADEVRTVYNDWDFSESGRIRQSQRMRELADKFDTDYVIADFVAPLAEMRRNFSADCVIWVDTIQQGRFADTNAMFEPPDRYDFRVTQQDCKKWADVIQTHLTQTLMLAS